MRKELTTSLAKRKPTVSKRRYNLDKLLTEAETSGAYPLPPEEREWVDASSVGREWPNDED